MERLYIDGMQASMRLLDLDVLLLPTEASSSRPGVIARSPVGTVPVGHSDINLPFGMSFVGKSYDEPTVLRAMYAYEQNFPAREVPSTLD